MTVVSRGVTVRPWWEEVDIIFDVGEVSPAELRERDEVTGFKPALSFIFAEYPVSSRHLKKKKERSYIFL